jgi:hypothetical protein
MVVAVLSLALALASTSCVGLWWWIGGGVGVGSAIVPNSRLDFLYHRQYQGAGLTPIDRGDRSPLVGYVELDDFGWYRDRQQPRLLLQQLQQMSATENVVVVLYTHGWRHNVSQNESDMRSFRETLRFLNAEVESDTFRAARRYLTGNADARVVGIAVGWRGQAWPELGRPFPAWFFPKYLLDLPVYLSAIGRKQTAHVVGETDLQYFLSALADLHQARWAKLKHGVAPMMSLVMVGHSFGGHALFDAAHERIESNLASAIVGSYVDSTSGMAPRAVPVAARLDRLAKDALPPATHSCRRVVESFGDLVVLINPAIEAASYKDVDALVHSARFRKDQPPVLVTFSSTNDGARNVVFRGLRLVTEAGRASTSADQRRMERVALGAYPEQHTNWLDLIDHSSGAKDLAKKGIEAPPARADLASPGETDSTWLAPILGHVTDADLSSTFTSGNVSLSRLPAGIGHSPAIVVNTSSDVINGHSDFFRQAFIHWLTRYVLQVQLRRLVRTDRVRALLKSRNFATLEDDAPPDTTESR